MQILPLKKTLYWCSKCNVPLIGQTCGCRNEGFKVPLVQPYELRPALSYDISLLNECLIRQFGSTPLQKIILFNKAGGVDRNELVIMNGEWFGWISFDPQKRETIFVPTEEGLKYIIPYAGKGLVDLGSILHSLKESGKKVRIGGKKFPLPDSHPDGPVIVKYGEKYGVGYIKEGYIRVKKIIIINPAGNLHNPDWDIVIRQNKYHLKNIERNAIRAIKQHMHDRPVVNISFSGGKDSTAVLNLARNAGVEDAYFVDTGVEFPETYQFVKEQGITNVLVGGDFWKGAVHAGPPGKDNRWCCKLLKMNPVKLYLQETGPCVTVQGNRWYESFNRASLEVTSENPNNPLQLNLSPIRNWRAFEVFLYLKWAEIPYNPLYEMGIERIGCYVCPSMLESEYERLRDLHPELAERWDLMLQEWAEKEGFSKDFISCGLWRWQELPAKMLEFCKERNITTRLHEIAAE